MIDVKFLRLGNMLVHGDVVVFVSAIFKSHFKVEDENGIERNSAQENLKPIPLTAEIIAKVVGIQREERGKLSDFDGVEIVWHYHGADVFEYNGEFYYATYTRYPGRGFKAGTRIESLHHLQNILHAITQNDPKINL